MNRPSATRGEFPWETRARQQAAALELLCPTCNQAPGVVCINILTKEPLHKFHPAHAARIPKQEI